jgi:hypothetical protein
MTDLTCNRNAFGAWCDHVRCATCKWRSRTGDRLRFLRREDGQALVELALVLPVLLIVILGIVDFGKAINYWNDENYVANLGARYASVGNLPTTGACANNPLNDPNALVGYVRCEAGIDSLELENGTSSNGVQSPGLSVCVYAPTNAVGGPVQVQVKAIYHWLPLPKILRTDSASFASSTLIGSATMRLEAKMPSSWINSPTPCA